MARPMDGTSENLESTNDEALGQFRNDSEVPPRRWSGCSEARVPGHTRVGFPDYGTVATSRKGQAPGPSRGSSYLQPKLYDPDSNDNTNIGVTHMAIDSYDSYEDEETYAGDAQYNLTSASYRRIIRLYSLVPITTLLTFLFFAFLRHSLWPARTGLPSFQWHLGLALTGATAWVASFALRAPIYMISSFLCSIHPAIAPLVSASFQVFIEETLRLSSLVITGIHIHDKLSPEDPSFSFVWTLSFGWAAAEVMVSIFQGYGQLLLYSDTTVKEQSAAMPDLASDPIHLYRDREHVASSEIDEIIRIRARIELETLYGIPVPEIPVFVSCLLRIDSITLSIALFLIISSWYLPYLSQSSSSQHPVSQAVLNTLPAFVCVSVLRTPLSLIWTLNVLPQIGLHAASYMSCIFALGAFFVGLGRWDAL